MTRFPPSSLRCQKRPNDDRIGCPKLDYNPLLEESHQPQERVAEVKNEIVVYSETAEVGMMIVVNIVVAVEKLTPSKFAEISSR